MSTVGLRWMKPASGPEATIITATAKTTAIAMIANSLVMPTAVMMLSTEKTMSMRTIWTSAERTPSGAGLVEPSSSASGSTLSWISVVAFQTRNSPPASSSRSRAEKSCPNRVTIGPVRWTIAAADASIARRKTSASPRPRLRANARRLCSTRFDKSAMKTRLSTPSTTSMAIRVASAAHEAGSAARRAIVSMRSLPLDPLDHPPDRGNLHALPGQELPIVAVAPPVPAALRVCVKGRGHSQTGGQLGRGRRMRLRIEHEDGIGVGPLVQADLPVEDVAEDLRGLQAAVQRDLEAARPSRARLAGFRHIEIAGVQEAVRSRGFSGDEFLLVEGDNPP